jgi:hypothetical protein
LPQWIIRLIAAANQHLSTTAAVEYEAKRHQIGADEDWDVPLNGRPITVCDATADIGSRIRSRTVTLRV